MRDTILSWLEVVGFLQRQNMHDDLNPSELVLDPKHPGLHDVHYESRRQYFFDLGRDYRLHEKGVPLVQYEPIENEIWAKISSELAKAHEVKACAMYLAGKKKLALATAKMPQLYELNQRIQKEHGISIVPAEGLLHTRTFFYYLAQRQMPCTQFIRHASHPEYTPEPDAVHDVLGHVPALMDREFSDLIELIGKGVMRADDEELTAWARIYWFSIEFGLLEEANELKVFGAGILSSYGEMEYCFSDAVTRLPFDLPQVIKTPYDPTCMQNILFVIRSFADLSEQIHRYMKI